MLWSIQCTHNLSSQQSCRTTSIFCDVIILDRLKKPLSGCNTRQSRKPLAGCLPLLQRISLSSSRCSLVRCTCDCLPHVTAPCSYRRQHCLLPVDLCTCACLHRGAMTTQRSTTCRWFKKWRVILHWASASIQRHRCYTSLIEYTMEFLQNRLLERLHYFQSEKYP